MSSKRSAKSKGTVALRVWIPLLVLVLTSQAALAQQTGEYTPSIGQVGKDVIWVPTPEALVERMLQMANVGPEDYVIDLGSGDGRTVIMAAEKFGARALGIEYNPDMVAYSIRKAKAAGVADRARFVEADIFESDFSQATVLTLYLLPTLNYRLRPKILDMRPGTRVVSNSFDMADWRADETITVASRTAYFWIVPAKLAGTWHLAFPDESRKWTLELEQKFQVLSGQFHLPDGWFDVLDGLVQGTEFRFHILDADGKHRQVSGHVVDDRLEGTLEMQDGSSSSWTAER